MNDGGARKRVPSLTERLAIIREEHASALSRALYDLIDNPVITPEDLEYQVNFWVKSAVAATELAVNEDNRAREVAIAQRKQQKKIDMFHRPGRFGHS